MTDWLKKNHRDLYEQVTKTVNYLDLPGNRDRMGLSAMTPQGQYYDGTFMPLYTDYQPKYLAWADEPNRTPAITLRFEAAEKALKPEYRQVYNAFFKTNPLASDDDLIEMGFPKRPSGGRHPSPIATNYPGFKILTHMIRQLIVVFFDNANEERAKPAGQHGAEIRWAILDAPPVHIDDLVHSAFDTHSPYTLTFDDSERGKTVYFALCWENTRGEKGPYSPFVSAIIP
jgi:hypothetical protein